MPNFDEIKDLITRCKTPFLRICDMHGNKIIVIEGGTTLQAIKELDDMEAMLKSYGKLEVCGATAEQAKANWKGVCKWVLIFDKVPGANAMNGMPGMNWGGNWGAPPPGFVSNEVMMAKLAQIELQMKHEKELAQLREKLGKKDEDPVEKYMGYAPMVFSMMGKDDAYIEKMIKWHALSKGAKTMNGLPETTNTLTFADADKLSPEQQNEKITALIESVRKKVKHEDLITLFKAVEKTPALAEKAVGILSTL